MIIDARLLTTSDFPFLLGPSVSSELGQVPGIHTERGLGLTWPGLSQITFSP